MINPVIISADPLAVRWSPPAVSRLLAGRDARESLQLIRRLFMLCGEAHSQAALRLLSDEAPPDAAAAAHERARETLRRLLLDWYPAFEGQPAPMACWPQLRAGEFAPLAQTLIFGEPPAQWLARGYAGWLAWIGEGRTVAARWLERLRPLQLPALPLLSDWSAGCAAAVGCDLSPLALERQALPAQFASLPAHRLLARFIALARALTSPDTLRVHRFSDGEWRCVAVECARGWLLHRAKTAADGRVVDYQILPPTAWHVAGNGLIWHTLRHLPPAEWRLQVLLIDPCVDFKINGEPNHA